MREQDGARDRGGGDRPSQDAGDLLRGASAREILAKITAGDPLELSPRVQERLRARALLLSPDRLRARSLARVARDALSYAGEPPLAAWLMGRIERSIEELMEEDREADRSAPATPELEESRYAFLANALGIELGVARRGCVVFNDLPDPVRADFFAVVVERTSVAAHAAASGRDGLVVENNVKRAIRALSLLEDQLGYGRFGGPSDEA